MEKKYFTNIEELKKQCIEIKETNNPVEVVELWKPCYLNERERRNPRETSIEVLRLDGYWDKIYFKLGDEELAKSVYSELEVFNRPITPLEKFHASF